MVPGLQKQVSGSTPLYTPIRSRHYCGAPAVKLGYHKLWGSTPLYHRMIISMKQPSMYISHVERTNQLYRTAHNETSSVNKGPNTLNVRRICVFLSQIVKQRMCTFYVY